MFTIDIASFGEGQHHIQRSPSAKDLEVEKDKFSDVDVGVFLNVERDKILAHLEVSATAHLTCDRTLQPFDEEIAGQYSVLFAIPDTAKPADKAEDYDEVKDWHPSDTELNLTSVTRDTLLLALPYRQIAPGAEDEDIQDTFGAPEEAEEEPIDPRWEKLKQLKGEGNNSNDID